MTTPERRHSFLCSNLVLAAAMIFCVTLPGALAQSEKQKPVKPYALIYGTVWTPQNRAAYGVKVKIRRAEDKKARWELYSDHAGEFAQRVPAGAADYIVWADLKVPKGQSPPQVKVHVDNDERVDIALHLTE